MDKSAEQFIKDRYDNHIIHWRDSEMIWAPLKFKEGVEFLVWGKIVPPPPSLPATTEVTKTLKKRKRQCQAAQKQVITNEVSKHETNETGGKQVVVEFFPWDKATLQTSVKQSVCESDLIRHWAYRDEEPYLHLVPSLYHWNWHNYRDMLVVISALNLIDDCKKAYLLVQ